MKTCITCICIFFLTTISFAQNNQKHYKSELDFGNGTVFSTFLDVNISRDQFTITSPKNADVRMFGWTKAKLARLIGKSPKKGIIIAINGKQKLDSLFGETKIPLFGELKFKGVVKNGELSGEFIDTNSESLGSLHGVNSDESSFDYKTHYTLLLKTVHDNIYSKSVLQTKDWNKFQIKNKKLFSTARDDIEVFLGFNMLAQKLPFTHMFLFISQDDEDVSQDEQDLDQLKSKKATVTFEEKSENTAYLLIKNFSTSKNELAEVFPGIIENKNYKNLIVDLRGNPGGGIDAAFEFANHITTEDTEVGYFVTNKLQYSGYEPELFTTLPELQPKNTKEFTNDLKTLGGVKLVFNKPNKPVFEGRIYILTNSKTGSTCEPIVYALKNSGRAIIIGEKTAGAMLAACPIEVHEKYTLMLPIADFFTYDGVRLDKVGVRPNIEVESDEALEKALELIKNETNN